MLGPQLVKTEAKLVRWEVLAAKWIHSRKAVIFLLAFFAGSVALAFHLIDGGQWVDLTKWAVGGYMIGNAGGAIAAALSPGKDG